VKISGLFLVLVFALALTSCGGESQKAPKIEESYGIRVLTPMDSWSSQNSSFPTTQSPLPLSGLGPSATPVPGCINYVPSAASITWANTTTGESGAAASLVDPEFLFGCFIGGIHWSASVPLAVGRNHITFEARGSGGAIVGRDFVYVDYSR